MTGQWIEESEWERIQRTIPIVCVDVLALGARGNRFTSAGLILRHTPHQGDRWCLIGGRMRIGETIVEAVERHVYGALGPHVRFCLSPSQQPCYVAQYMPFARDDLPVDPRKHAIGLTFVLEVSGTPQPRDEALDFQWFPISRLPDTEAFGFQQNQVVQSCLMTLASIGEGDARWPQPLRPRSRPRLPRNRELVE